MSMVGTVEYPNPDIIPFRPIECPNGDNTAKAGEIVKSGPHYGLLQDNCKNQDVRGIMTRGHVRARKTAAAIADNAPLTLVANPTGTKNDKWYRTALTTEPIHGYSGELAPLNSTDVLVFMTQAPYQLMP